MRVEEQKLYERLLKKYSKDKGLYRLIDLFIMENAQIITDKSENGNRTDNMIKEMIGMYSFRDKLSAVEELEEEKINKLNKTNKVEEEYEDTYNVENLL